MNNTLSQRPWAQWIAVAGLLLVFAATAMPLLKISQELYRWIYAAGAVMAIAGRACAKSPSPDLRVRRLVRLELWAAIMFGVGAFFMFWYPRQTDWMAFTLAGGAIEVYASLMRPRAARQASGKGKKS